MEKKKKKEKESSGFPLDDMLDGDFEVEPVDDWEKKEKERREKAAGLLAQAIFKSDMSSEEAIKRTIIKFQDMANLMRSI